MADKPQKSWQARSEFNERRYRRVDTRVWNDARVRAWCAYCGDMPKDS